MIVDTKGAINLENLGMKISPDFTLDELKTNSHFANFRFWGSNDDYERYSINGALIDNLPFYAFLIFYKNKASRISIEYTTLMSEFRNVDLAKQKEQISLTKKQHDEWLLNEHGTTKKKYPWGLINSVIDKTGFPYIDIIYNNPPFENW